MSRTVLLSDEHHHDLKVAPRHGAAFGDETNVVRLFPTEFVEAQREFPLLFSRSESEGWHAVALTGLGKGENLFFEGGGWTSRYVPAIQRRGPFAIAMTPSAGGGREAMLRIDMDDPRVGREDGLPLFKPNGGNAPYLEHVCAALRTVHDGLAVSGAFFAAVESANLIEPVRIEIQLSEETRYALPDFFAIGADRLSAARAEDLGALNAAGFLPLAFAAAFSLSNVDRLIALKTARGATNGRP